MDGAPVVGHNRAVTDARADRATLASIAAAAVAQAAFFALDARIPRDPMMTGMKALDAYDRLGESVGRALVEAVVDRAGWYHVALGALWRVWRAPAALDAVFLGWLVVILGATASIGRTVAGPRGGLAAVWLAIGLPPVLLFTRQSWIHTPEAGLTLAATAVVLADPRLARLRTIGLAIALGALAIRLRPSAMAPLAALVVAMGVARPPWGRLAAVLAPWAAAAAWTWATMGAYLAAKGPGGWLHERPLGWLAEQIPQTTGYLGGAALVVAAGITARTRPAWGRPAAAWAIAAGLAPLLLMLRFRSGSHDFTWWGPALAVAAAPALARAPWVAAIPAAASLIAPFVPGVAGSGLRDVLGPHDLPAPLDLRAPRRDWGAATVAAALDAACPSDTRGACHVLAPSGLFYPLRNEDLGNLELFLMREDRVQLRALGDGVRGGFAAWRVDAMAVWDCGDADAWGYDKHPDLALRTVEAVRALELTPVVSVDVGGCTWHWLGPKRGVPHPEALPAGGGRGWDPDGMARRNEAWLAAHPDQRGRTMLPRASRLRGEAL